MTPTELAQHIIDHHGDTDFNTWLAGLRPQLNLEVVREITNQAIEYYLHNANKALDLATIGQQAA